MRVKHRQICDKLLWNTITVLAYLTTIDIIGFAIQRHSRPLSGQHKAIVKSDNPISSIISTVHYLMQAETEADITVNPIGCDATIQPKLGGISKPYVTVIVAGETPVRQISS